MEDGSERNGLRSPRSPRQGGLPPTTPSGGTVEELNRQQTKIIEVYGFVGCIATYLAYICYLLWAFLPESILNSIGVSYYPSKYWAIAVPGYLVMVGALAGIIYMAINLATTVPLDSFHSLADQHSRQLPEKGLKAFEKEVGTPEISDLPVTVANKLMFPPPPRNRFASIKRPPVHVPELRSVSGLGLDYVMSRGGGELIDSNTLESAEGL